MGDVDAVCIHSYGTREGKVASPLLGRFTPDTHFIVGWVDPRSSLDTKEWENLHPSDTRDRTLIVEPVTKRLVAWAIWPPKKTMTWIQSPPFHLKETHIHHDVTSVN